MGSDLDSGYILQKREAGEFSWNYGTQQVTDIKCYRLLVVRDEVSANYLLWLSKYVVWHCLLLTETYVGFIWQYCHFLSTSGLQRRLYTVNLKYEFTEQVFFATQYLDTKYVQEESQSLKITKWQFCANIFNSISCGVDLKSKCKSSVG